MHISVGRSLGILWIVAVLAACTTAPQATTAPSTAAVAPTAAPTVAATIGPFTFAKGTLVAGVDVGGLTSEQAMARLDEALAPLAQPLQLSVGNEQLLIEPEQIKLEVPVAALLDKAKVQQAAGLERVVPLEVEYDREALRAQLAPLAEKVATPGQTRLVTETDRYSRTFVYEPGLALDLDGALKAIDERLREPGAARSLELTITPQGKAEPVGFDQLRAALEEMAGRWDGVVGIYLYDLKTGETIALNEKTVFSGASVLKVPIMLQTYISLPTLSDEERELMTAMIGKSDNLAANALLAKAAGGQGTEAALEGVQQMNATLEALGLEHTYQNLPYEAGEYLIKVRKMKIAKGPAEEGAPPFTEADPYVRTTPAEIGQLLVWMRQCSAGDGPLLERFATLTAARCAEMIDWLEQNEDDTRMVAGFPPGTDVAHKSGWVEDMQADAGIVSTPGGDFVLALYVYQQQRNSYLPDEVAAPVLAAFARLVYSGYNPAVVKAN